MRGWSNYFFMVGSAAAALIGLMFVVATLTAGRDQGELETGKKLYTTPIVWHLGVIVVLSGGAVMPSMTPAWLGAGTLCAGTIGACYSLYIALGVFRSRLATSFTGYDAFWYGGAPAVVYAGAALSGWGMIFAAPWATTGLAAALMCLLMVSIHNEWDLVTFLAPAAPNATGTDAGEKKP